jgi:hypothetical protein
MSTTITPTVSPFVTNDQFRGDFPAFKDPELFSNATLTMYLTAAGNLLDPWKWGDLWTMGQELWAAHFLLLDRIDESSVERGGVTPAGPITNKSVGAVTVGYSENGMEDSGGHWNQTSFGRRFLRFARLVGTGGSQLNGACPFPGNWFPGSAAAYSFGLGGLPYYPLW